MAIEAVFVWGPQRCGEVAVRTVPDMETGEQFPICQKHSEAYDAYMESQKGSEQNDVADQG